MTPGAGPFILAPRGIISTNLVEVNYIPNSTALGHVFSDKKIVLKVFILIIDFSLCDLDMQRTKTIILLSKRSYKNHS